MDQKFDEIHQKYKNYIYRIAFKYLHNKEDAEEATQDTLLKVWQLINRIDDYEARDKAFIAKVAQYTAIDYYRKRKSNQYTRIVYEECDLQTLSAEDIILHKNTANQFLNDLRRVDRNAAAILCMKYIDELSHEEIAAILGITPAASRKRLSRALKLMRNSERIKKYKLHPFIITLIVIAIILLTACAIQPIRNFFVEIFKEFTCFRKDNTEIIEMLNPEEVAFGYIPEGYSFYEERLGDRTRLFIFSSDDPDKKDFTVLFEFNRTINNKNINTEGGGTEVIQINGHKCLASYSSEIEETTATIYLDDSVLEYVGNLNREEMTTFLKAINLLNQK